MQRKIACAGSVVLMALSCALAQTPKGARVLIQSEAGFDVDMAAAISHEHVPVQLTENGQTATYALVDSQSDWVHWLKEKYQIQSGQQASQAEHVQNAPIFPMYSADNNSSSWVATEREGTTEKRVEHFTGKVMLVDIKTGDIVWSDEVSKMSNGGLLFHNARQRAANQIASDLRKFIEDKPK